MPSLLDNPVMLRDLLRKAMIKLGVTAVEAADLMDLNENTVSHFLNHTVTEPTEETRVKMESFINDSGITFRTVTNATARGKFGVGRVKGSKNLERPEVRAAVNYAIKQVESGTIKMKELRKICSSGPNWHLRNLKINRCSVLTPQMKKLVAWHREKIGTPDEREAAILRGINSSPISKAGGGGVRAIFSAIRQTLPLRILGRLGERSGYGCHHGQYVSFHH